MGGGSIRLLCSVEKALARLVGIPKAKTGSGRSHHWEGRPSSGTRPPHFLSGSSLGQQLGAVSLPRRESERGSSMATIDTYKIMEISIHSTTIY